MGGGAGGHAASGAAQTAAGTQAQPAAWGNSGRAPVNWLFYALFRHTAGSVSRALGLSRSGAVQPLSQAPPQPRLVASRVRQGATGLPFHAKRQPGLLCCYTELYIAWRMHACWFISLATVVQQEDGTGAAVGKH